MGTGLSTGNGGTGLAGDSGGGGASDASVIRLGVPDGYGSTNTKIMRYPTAIINDGTDLTLSQSTTLGDSITINTAGSYTITLIADPSTGFQHFGLSINSTELTTNIESITAATRLSSIRIPDFNTPASQTMAFKCSVDDVIRAHTNGSAFGSFNSIAIFQVLGPL